MTNSTLLDPDDYCEVHCSDSQKGFPDKRSTCLVDSEWSNPLGCKGVCDPEVVVDSGTLQRNATSVKEKKKLLNNKKRCFKDGQRVDNEPYFEGTSCTFDQGVCGKDKDEYVYYQRELDVKCSTEGFWESIHGKAVTEPICKSHPCEKYPEPAQWEEWECKFDDPAMIGLAEVDHKYNEGVTCTLKSCVTDYVPRMPSKTTCMNWEWDETLKCMPDQTPCEISNLTVANGEIDCSDATKVAGEPGKVLGGEICDFECEYGYIKKGDAQCIGEAWNSINCGK